MSDDAKKGLDLSKLLKKKSQTDSTPAPEAQSSQPQEGAPPPSAEPPPEKKKGLDMSKLLAKAKPQAPAEPPPQEKPAEPSPPPVTQQAKPPTTTPPTHQPQRPMTQPKPSPTKPAGEPAIEGPDVSVLFNATKPAEKPAQRPPPPKPQPKPQPPPKPPPTQAKPPPKPEPPKEDPAPVIAAATRATTGVVAAQNTAFSSSVEAITSREGAKGLKLDVTVAETRKYPRGYYGCDEMFLHAEQMFDIVRRHVWRVRPEHKAGFQVAYRLVGTTLFDCGVIWDGQNIHELVDELPKNPTVTAITDADAIIDQVRGRFTCTLTNARNISKSEGDPWLLYWLGVRIQDGMDKAQLENIREQDNARLEAKDKVRKASKDAVDCFANLMEWQIKPIEKSIIEPLFVRATLALPVPVEILFHLENGKLTVLQGKPGETLMPGALELKVDEMAIEASFVGECSFYYLMLSNHIQLSGDLKLLNDLNIITNPYALDLVKFVNKTGKPIGPDNRFQKAPVKTSGPVRDPYLSAL